MNKIHVFIILFLIVFCINASLSMLMSGNDFFHLTGTKLFIRFWIAFMLTFTHGQKIQNWYAKNFTKKNDT